MLPIAELPIVKIADRIMDPCTEKEALTAIASFMKDNSLLSAEDIHLAMKNEFSVIPTTYLGTPDCPCKKCREHYSQEHYTSIYPCAITEAINWDLQEQHKDAFKTWMQGFSAGELVQLINTVLPREDEFSKNRLIHFSGACRKVEPYLSPELTKYLVDPELVSYIRFLDENRWGVDDNYMFEQWDRMDDRWIALMDTADDKLHILLDPRDYHIYDEDQDCVCHKPAFPNEPGYTIGMAWDDCGKYYCCETMTPRKRQEQIKEKEDEAARRIVDNANNIVCEFLRAVYEAEVLLWKLYRDTVM